MQFTCKDESACVQSGGCCFGFLPPVNLAKKHSLVLCCKYLGVGIYNTGQSGGILQLSAAPLWPLMEVKSASFIKVLSLLSSGYSHSSNTNITNPLPAQVRRPGLKAYAFFDTRFSLFMGNLPRRLHLPGYRHITSYPSTVFAFSWPVTRHHVLFEAPSDLSTLFIPSPIFTTLKISHYVLRFSFKHHMRSAKNGVYRLRHIDRELGRDSLSSLLCRRNENSFRRYPYLFSSNLYRSPRTFSNFPLSKAFVISNHVRGIGEGLSSSVEVHIEGSFHCEQGHRFPIIA